MNRSSVPQNPPAAFFRACKNQGIAPTRYLFYVNISKQIAALFEKTPCDCGHAHGPHYELTDVFRCSTSRYGIGEIAGSNMTPRGLHRIAEKHGGGYPVGAVFKNRQLSGYTWNGEPGGLITHRIMWLEGLEPGFNRGGDRDSKNRYIYIHGTGHEPGIGRPASHGCVHLSAADLIPLYNKLPEGTLVWISER
jgi:hypothetical protein